MVARITQEAVEVLAQDPSTARITQEAVEVLAQDPSTAMFTQMAVEVILDGKIWHYTDGDLVGAGANIDSISYIINPPPLNTSSFMFIL